MSLNENLLGPEPTLLPERPEAQAAVDSGIAPVEVVRAYPDLSEAWALLAETALDNDDPVAAYAYARTGYHRGLDQLRRAGWKGFGPVPFAHRPNQGFLRSLAALSRAAGGIGEVAEQDRCAKFLADSDPTAPAQLGL
ncbi:DUF3151 domain-containing protein [Actinosynnema pretiosum subsp. pretiosum]|uniref:DUF3151 domain-containing protein n=2 Tax=Actinosynnema TaxID=40566 RepID=C6WR17_ACTMD|nr:DUF3151 domain-containing protein [Actinosynnema mirum]ACU40710.1 hypothetical protein Amir_6915 [Actinosynnema mirum DSM 43827]AXX34215.1 hypothetical protein APASM_6850 [Actinosynnema pretiosum subsp. pretiosum]QUF02064.1 DUF3151 domain-containing protein [Actinosynnema pretiosum subsp. pretiosum]